MAITFVQSATGTTGGGGAGTVSATLPGVAAGNVLVVTVAWWNSSNSGATAVASSPARTWAQDASRVNTQNVNGFGYQGAAVHSAAATAGGSHTVTVTLPGFSWGHVTVAEFAGGPFTVDRTALASNTTATPSVGPTLATTDAAELAVAVLSTNSTNAAATNVGITTPAGYTNLARVQNAAEVAAYSADYRVLSATGTQSASWGTLNYPAGDKEWAAALVTYKAPSDLSAAVSGAATGSAGITTVSRFAGTTARAVAAVPSAALRTGVRFAASRGGVATASAPTLSLVGPSVTLDAGFTLDSGSITLDGAGAFTSLAASASGRAAAPIAELSEGAPLDAAVSTVSTADAELSSEFRAAALASGAAKASATTLRTAKPLSGSGAGQAAAWGRMHKLPPDLYLGASASASGSGRAHLGRVWGRLPRSGLQKVLRNLNRVFEKGPEPVLALRINAPGGAHWRIEPAAALKPRVLEVRSPHREDAEFALEGRTIAELRDAIAATPGLTLVFATEDPRVLALGALALVPGEGKEFESNGDHIHAQASLLWSWADPVGRWLDQARLDVAEALRMLVVRQSGGEWSDLWANYFGIRRRLFESDASQNRRTEWEWRRPRNNAKAIELNALEILGKEIWVREPWKEMMTVSRSVIGGDDHLPNEPEYAYHRMQLRSRNFEDWGPIVEEVEPDRPAGTLFISPMALPWPWEVDCASGRGVEFGATMGHGAHVMDYDGQIISHNWNLSSSWVALAPVIVWPEYFQFDAAPKAAAAATASLRSVPRFAAAAGAEASRLGADLLTYSGFRATLARAQATSTATLLQPRLLAASRTAASTASATTLTVPVVAQPPTTSTVWPTAGRTWLLDPDDAARRTMDPDGVRVARIDDAGGDASRFWTQDNNPSARAPLVTAFGRRMLDFDQGFANYDGSAPVTADFAAVGAASTYAAVWVTPPVLGASLCPIMGAYTNGGYAPANMLAIEASSSGRKARAYRATASAFREASASFNWQPNTAYLITFRFNADGSITVFVDGTKLTTTAPNGAIAPGTTISPSGSQLGSYWPESGALGAGAVAAYGKIGATMRFGVAYTDAQVATLAQVKANRHTGAAPTPVSHTLFTGAETGVQQANWFDGLVGGNKIRVGRSGQVTALRFYRIDPASAPVSIKLWSAAGAELASASLAGVGTATGWIERTLAAPVALSANALVVVSVFHSNGRFADNQGYFVEAKSSGPLMAPAHDGADGTNGVYQPAASHIFPTWSTNASNFWTDLRFQ